MASIDNKYKSKLFISETDCTDLFMTTSGDQTIDGSKTFSSDIQGTAVRARWADLAECYLTDKEYPNGNLEVQMLLDEGYITDSSINEEKTCEMMNDYIKVTSDYKKYKFTYQEVGDEDICD